MTFQSVGLYFDKSLLLADDWTRVGWYPVGLISRQFCANPTGCPGGRCGDSKPLPMPPPRPSVYTYCVCVWVHWRQHSICDPCHASLPTFKMLETKCIWSPSNFVSCLFSDNFDVRSGPQSNFLGLMGKERMQKRVGVSATGANNEKRVRRRE